MNLAFCSSCSHHEFYGESKNLRGSGTRNIPKPEFCAKCGAKMLYSCQGCGTHRRSMEDKFCTKCGKPYKQG